MALTETGVLYFTMYSNTNVKSYKKLHSFEQRITIVASFVP